MGRTAEEKEKVEVAVLQARVAHDAHPPRPPPPLAMEMLSEEEMATAIRRSEEDTVDTARHQRLVDKLEEEGKKRLDLAVVDAKGKRIWVQYLGNVNNQARNAAPPLSTKGMMRFLKRQSYSVYRGIALHPCTALGQNLRRA